MQALGSLVLPLGGDDLRPTLPRGLGLARHRALHPLRDLHVLDLDHAPRRPPRVGLLVDYRLQLLVYGLAVAEQIVEVLLTKHASQGSLGDLAGRKYIVLYLYYRLVRIHYPEVQNRIYLCGHVIPGYQVLGGHVHGHGPQIDLYHLVHYGDEEEEPWSFSPTLYPP